MIGIILCKTIFIFMLATCVTALLESSLFPDKGNIWEYLATEVLRLLPSWRKICNRYPYMFNGSSFSTASYLQSH